MMRQRLAVIGFSYLFGLLLASVFLYVKFAPQLITILLVFNSFMAIVFLKNKPFTYIIIPVTIAFITYSLYATVLEAEIKSITDGRAYLIEGVITEKEGIGNDIAIYTIHSDTADFIMYAEDTDTTVGDKLTFGCSFSLLENSAPFKSADYYLSKGIRLRGTLKSDITVEKNEEWNLFTELYKYREKLAGEFSYLYPDNGSAMMKGIFLGDKSGFSGYESYCIKAAGVAHLTAVSGMHLTLIVSILASLLKMTRLSVLPRTNIIVIILFILCFMVFFGLTASVTRSGIMLIIHYMAGFFYRKGACMNSLGTAILIICLSNPLACHDAGFMLSVATTIGAGEIAPKVSKHLTDKYERLPVRLTDCVCCSVFSSLMGLPLSLIYFNMFSLYGVIVSIITVPVFTVALGFMLIYALTGGFLNVLLIPAHYCCKMMMELFIFVANLPYSHYHYSSPVTAYIMLGAIVIAVCLVILVKKNKGFSVLMSLCFTILIYTGFIAIDKRIESKYMRITPGSDGENGYVLISTPDYCGAVITGGGDYVCTGLLTLMMGENKRHLDFLRITENSTNSLKMASDMYSDICDVVILDKKDKYLADNLLLFQGCEVYETYTINKASSDISFDKDNTTMTFDGYCVNISDITKAADDKINICYGYIKAEPYSDTILFLIDKKQKELTDNCTALYYTETSITATQGGIVINKKHI
ncbi:MAG: ComEC/Rec2 family competence protein [Ruminococcaceae bacterium]|nr:ComEC/Rec2 family competence protein [Oscillospiraceae bacterium]